jgi:hypothetical protein
MTLSSNDKVKHDTQKVNRFCHRMTKALKAGGSPVLSSNDKTGKHDKRAKTLVANLPQGLERAKMLGFAEFVSAHKKGGMPGFAEFFPFQVVCKLE